MNKRGDFIVGFNFVQSRCEVDRSHRHGRVTVNKAWDATFLPQTTLNLVQQPELAVTKHRPDFGPAIRGPGPSLIGTPPSPTTSLAG